MMTFFGFKLWGGDNNPKAKTQDRPGDPYPEIPLESSLAAQSYIAGCNERIAEMDSQGDSRATNRPPWLRD